MFNIQRFQGAITGCIVSMVIMGWIVFGTQIATAEGKIKQPTLPTSIEGCEFNVTSTGKYE